ncbi:MAG: hypothetical protein EPN85_00255 [Bacteroidetes bacterium]|nr:MAG: hypothetical protein EPN85_00255 [Bacteroidota bacterium]
MRKTIIFIFALVLIGAGIFFYLYRGGELFEKMLVWKNVTEGVIEYEVTYPKLDPNSMIAAALPDKAYMRFKNNNMITEMSAMMFNISYISNQSNKSVAQTFTLFSKKNVSDISAADMKKLNGSYLSSIEEGTHTRQIAGFTCKEVIAKLQTGESIRVYYTNDIGINNPNWSNPYTKIDGVLMDFQLESYGLSMHLKAKTLLPQKIEDSAFDIPADQQKIPFAELEAMLRAAVSN